MPKKIFVISKVKNESDIIESFCRYNLMYSDGILILDNGSTDNTKEIIQNLIDEGLPIYWMDDTHIKHPSIHIRGSWSRKAIYEYGVDLVITLDADEFLYHTDGINPRETLEDLRDDVEYQIPWRTYVYENEPDIELGFMPNNFTHYRNPSLECYNKALMSKFLIEEKQACFAPGSHALIFPPEHQGSVLIENPPKLVYAHFPLRSKTQLMNKVVPEWIRLWKNPLPILEEGRGFQYGLIWDDIKMHGEVTQKLTSEHCIKYGVLDTYLSKVLPGIESCLTIEGKIDISFCSDKLGLRYTDYEDIKKTFLRATLTEIESALMLLPKREWEAIKLLERTQQENTSIIAQNNALTQQISNIYNSNTWKAGKKLQKVFRFFVP
jgi:glycosyltransferase involved in cell wall biosynthesis